MRCVMVATAVAGTVSEMRCGPKKRLRPARGLVTALTAAILLLLNVCTAWARAYPPPPRRIFQGESGAPAAVYARAVRKHPAVIQVVGWWGGRLTGMFTTAAAARARLMIGITTASASREVITPGAIAAGYGDGWLLELGRAIAASGHPVYIRLLPEMNGYWNFYSAFNSDGSPRGASRSTAAFRAAWKRVTLILRGGSLTHVDQVLTRLGMPPVHTTQNLPAGQVAMLWVPQLAGEPNIPGNQPRSYWPGRPWVDWVGTDFYSRFDDFSALSSFYSAFGGAPFVFGEYGLWGADDPGYVHRLFRWIDTHPRTRMLVYNEGGGADGPFSLSRHPRAARALRRALASSHFPAFAADW